MKHYRFAFYVSQKVRSINFGEMIACGARAHGDLVETIPADTFTEPLEAFDGGAHLGLARASKRISEANLKAGKHHLFFDKGYAQRGKYWRMSADSWQPLAYFQRYMHPDDRMSRLGVTFRPSVRDKEIEKPIMYAASCQNYANFFNLGDVNDYNYFVLSRLRENSTRPIIFRPNPSWYTKHFDEFRPLHETVPGVTLSSPDFDFVRQLKGCHALVTHGTSAALSALTAGIPNMIIGGGICKSLALEWEDWKGLESPPKMKDVLRTQLFNDLAYCQWTEDELRSGEAWGELRSVLAFLEGGGEPEITDVLRQYKLMHRHPEYFKGHTMLKYEPIISELIKETDSETLLDYGSGKGVAYQTPYCQHKHWNVGVTLYDPGIPEHATVPAARFDAVICCDVMEHVPEYAVQETLQTIIAYADKFVFFSIATTPASKGLPDGLNCHLTVKPHEWWQTQIDQATAAVGGAGLIVKLSTKAPAPTVKVETSIGAEANP